MKLGKILYVTSRKAWHTWLKHHSDKEKEIWLVYFRKDSGKKRIPYNHAVEEALCFGWIDGMQKSIDTERFAQRFSPRKPRSSLSPMNQVRIERLWKAGKMTEVGLAAVKSQLKKQFIIPSDIRKALQVDKVVWRNFLVFTPTYKRIRIGWIDGVRKRPEEFKKRFAYFLKMTRQNKMFGMVR